MATASKNFPGVYSSIIDRSAFTPVVSRFQAGLIGVASKGPFNTPTRVRSIRDFQQTFGKPVVTTFTDKNPNGCGYYLADAVAVVSAISDGLTVVRVGNQYTPVAGAAATGTSTTLSTAQAAVFPPTPFYIRVKQAGYPSTVNARVTAVSNNGAGPDITLDRTTPLAAAYRAATVDFSLQDGAANEAESVLYGYGYSSVPTTGTVTGDKNAFSFSLVNGNASDLAVGDVFKIMASGKVTTSEVRIKRVVDASPNVIVELETSNDTQVGYQALPLQDSYASGDGARIFKVNTQSQGLIQAWSLTALTAGTWANGTDSKTGLYVGVRPGSKAGTKRLEVYENGALVESFDGLSDDESSDDRYTKRINGVSRYFTIAARSSVTHAANTVNPWNTTYQVQALSASPKSMPFGAINHGSAVGTHGSFALGYNGLSATDADFIGTVNTDGSLTGIKAFEDADNITIDVLAAPMDEISPAVMQELGRVARAINAVALVDVPSGLNARNAVDWHNGAGGQFASRGRLDTPNVAFYWNWFQIADRFSSTANSLKWVPPTIGALRCLAATFDTSKPWFAAAGETRGLIPEALQVEFPRVSDDAKSAMYGDGNSVNPILFNRGRVMLFGERTSQRAESKLTALHSVILVNTVVKGLSAIARRYVFDPNDATLLANLKSEFRDYLSKVENDRGIEGYNLVMDETNNTPDTRNRREVRVDLALIPVDSVERIFLNATVRESGAVLNQATA